MMQTFFNYLIFPGMFFSIFMGGVGWWLERKLTARFQYRVGPPWFQNFFDITKLFLKETIIPISATKSLFILSPLLTMSSVALFTLIVTQNYFLNLQFSGDILVALYLLIIPSLFIIFGALSSGNPLALAGAARETKLMLAYELVFITSIVIVVIKSGGALLINDIVNRQLQSAPYIKSLSGIIAFILSFFYVQAKLGIIPFDMPEAEQEIMAGTMVEYSGPLLGFYRLSKLILYFSLPLFIISLLWPGKYLDSILKFFLIIFLISVIKNINPRLRIKDALTFFWFYLFPLGIFGILSAIKGW